MWKVVGTRACTLLISNWIGNNQVCCGPEWRDKIGIAQHPFQIWCCNTMIGLSWSWRSRSWSKLHQTYHTTFSFSKTAWCPPSVILNLNRFVTKKVVGCIHWLPCHTHLASNRPVLYLSINIQTYLAMACWIFSQNLFLNRLHWLHLISFWWHTSINWLCFPILKWQFD